MKFAPAKRAATNIVASDSDSIFKEPAAQLRSLGASDAPEHAASQNMRHAPEVARLNDVLTMAAGTTGCMQNI
jgi:hypothetical protein